LLSLHPTLEELGTMLRKKLRRRDPNSDLTLNQKALMVLLIAQNMLPSMKTIWAKEQKRLENGLKETIN